LQNAVGNGDLSPEQAREIWQQHVERAKNYSQAMTVTAMLVAVAITAAVSSGQTLKPSLTPNEGIP